MITKSFLPNYFIVLLFVLNAKNLIAGVTCSGNKGPLVKIGKVFSTDGNYKEYQGRFLFPNGQVIELKAFHQISGHERGQLRFYVENSKLYRGSNTQVEEIASLKFSHDDRKPMLLLSEEIVTNQHVKTKAFETVVERTDALFPTNPMYDGGEYAIQAKIEYKKHGDRWVQENGSLNIYKLTDKQNKKRLVNTISGEGVLNSIRDTFHLKQ